MKEDMKERMVHNEKSALDRTGLMYLLLYSEINTQFSLGKQNCNASVACRFDVHMSHMTSIHCFCFQ